MLIAIPCLNEADRIGAVLAALPTHVPGVRHIEVMVVDDGSTDASAIIARRAGAHVLRHEKTRGVGAAFQTALQYAVERRAEVMVTIDADGQFLPAEIPSLVGPIVAGTHDFVTASRFMDRDRVPAGIPRVKLWGNRRVAQLVSRMAGRRFYDVSCGFRAYSREAILQLNLHGAFTYTQESCLQLSFKGLRMLEVPCTVRYDIDKVSRVADSILRYAVKSSLIMLRAYRDYHPIRFFGGLAGGFLTGGAGLGALLIAHYLRAGHFTGMLWAGFSGAFLFVIGLVLLAVGLIADMLDRDRRTQERILYLLKKNASGSVAAFDGMTTRPGVSGRTRAQVRPLVIQRGAFRR